MSLKNIVFISVCMYNGFTQLSWKHCSVIFPLFVLKNLTTNEAEICTGKLYYMHLHSQWVGIHVMAKNLIYKRYQNPSKGTVRVTVRYQFAPKDCWIYYVLYAQELQSSNSQVFSITHFFACKYTGHCISSIIRYLCNLCIKTW